MFERVIICAVLAALSSRFRSLPPTRKAAAPLRVRRSSRANLTAERWARAGSAYDMLILSTMFIWAILLESAFLLALAGAVLGVIHWKDRKKRLPFTQKILRPPGESLRVRLIELDEKLNDRFVQLFFSQRTRPS